MFHASHKVMKDKVQGGLSVDFLTHQLTSHTHQPSPSTTTPLPSASHLAFKIHLQCHFTRFGDGGLFIR